jgi:hypothetical protein
VDSEPGPEDNLGERAGGGFVEEDILLFEVVEKREILTFEFVKGLSRADGVGDDELLAGFLVFESRFVLVSFRKMLRRRDLVALFCLQIEGGIGGDEVFDDSTVNLDDVDCASAIGSCKFDQKRPFRVVGCLVFGDLLLLYASGSLGSVLSSETSEVVVSAMVENRQKSLAVEVILRELSVDLVLV